MSYHNRSTNQSSNRQTSNTPLTNTNTRTASPGANVRTASIAPNTNALVVSVGGDGKSTCLCSDGVTYTNCGSECQCCHKIAQRKKPVRIEPIYKTFSCPCSSYAITNASGNVECEMDLGGSKRRLKAVVIKNHTMNNAQPRVRDKWDCGNESKIRCGEGEIKWESLHVVRIESIDSGNVAKINTKSSNSNCHIPPTTLIEYGSETTPNIEYDYSDINGIDITNPVSSLNDVLLFKDKEEAFWWDYFKGQGESPSTSDYLNKDGVTMFFPGKYYPDHKLITKVHVNKHDILRANLKAEWDYISYSSNSNRFIVGTGGQIVKIKLVGINNPVVDITIKNSSGRSILKRKLQGVVINNEFVLQQQIPSIPSGKEVETYHVEINPSADTHYYPDDYDSSFSGSNLISAGVMKYTIWQHKASKIIISSNQSTIANTTTTTVPVSISGVINSETHVEKSLVQTVSLTRSSGTHLFYVNQEKNRRIKDLESDQVIKMIIKGNDDGQEMKCYDQFALMVDPTQNLVDPFYTRKDASGVEITTGRIEIGMNFEGTFTKTATIKKSIDLDADLHESCAEDEIIEIITNKFEVDDTNKLMAGMMVSCINQSGGEFISLLDSVDCEKSITLRDHTSINNDTLLTFTFSDGGEVIAIDKDNSRVTGGKCLNLPENTILNFTKRNQPVISGNITFDYSGSNKITMTNTVNNVKFGEGVQGFTFDTDSYITLTPNAQDQRVETFSGQELIIDFLKFDKDYNRASKSVTVVTPPTKGTTSIVRQGKVGDVVDYMLGYTPVKGFTGNDKIKFTMTDANDQVSNEKTIFITIK